MNCLVVVDKAILPNPGANEDCDKATLEVKRLEGEFDDLLIGYQRQLKYVLKTHLITCAGTDCWT